MKNYFFLSLPGVVGYEKKRFFSSSVVLLLPVSVLSFLLKNTAILTRLNWPIFATRPTKKELNSNRSQTGLELFATRYPTYQHKKLMDLADISPVWFCLFGFLVDKNFFLNKSFLNENCITAAQAAAAAELLVSSRCPRENI